MCLQIPRSRTEGVLWLETECNGIVSEAVPLVLTLDLDIAEEIQGFRELPNCQNIPELELHNFLTDIGMTLQYAEHLWGPSNRRIERIGELQPFLLFFRVGPQKYFLLLINQFLGRQTIFSFQYFPSSATFDLECAQLIPMQS